MDRNLRKAWSKRNLALAWTRTLTNQEAAYKNHFRAIYRSYSLASADHLQDLQRRLLSGQFRTTAAERIYYPKESGIQRPITLLSVEDQVVYQALANVVADRLYGRVRHRYGRLVFGNVYAGPRSRFFYRDWRRTYRQFAGAIRRAYSRGFTYTASFDLTACYDSIDHAVLGHFLEDLGLSRDFTSHLSATLSGWTASVSATGRLCIYAGHGLPQGPLPSGLLAECVLRHFDNQEEASRSHRYFRYVDDIRLFAKTERALRERMVALDLSSKQIGLFPQSSKIHVHRVKNIEDEIRSVSRPLEAEALAPEPDQAKLRKRLWMLTPRLRVQNATRFKYVLSHARPQSALSKRLIEIAARYPHLGPPVFSYLARGSQHPKRVSLACVALLARHDLYPGFASSLLFALLDRIHPAVAWRVAKPCRRYLSTDHPDLRAAAASHLLAQGRLSAAQLRYHMTRSAHWWERAFLVHRARNGAAALLNRSLRDPVADVALLAAEHIASSGISVERPARSAHRAAQRVLKAAGVIGRIQSTEDPISGLVAEVLGKPLAQISWRQIFGTQYRALVPRFVRWNAYAESDPTAWINLTDTVNDTVLQRLYRHDTTLGTYVLGNMGSVLNAPTGRLAVSYPRVYDAAQAIHELRLESELSHAQVRQTQMETRRIAFSELPPAQRALRAAYLELWSNW